MRSSDFSATFSGFLMAASSFLQQVFNKLHWHLLVKRGFWTAKYLSIKRYAWKYLYIYTARNVTWQYIYIYTLSLVRIGVEKSTQNQVRRQVRYSGAVVHYGSVGMYGRLWCSGAVRRYGTIRMLVRRKAPAVPPYHPNCTTHCTQLVSYSVVPLRSYPYVNERNGLETYEPYDAIWH